jgi:hypothetical protein
VKAGSFKCVLWVREDAPTSRIPTAEVFCLSRDRDESHFLIA